MTVFNEHKGAAPGRVRLTATAAVLILCSLRAVGGFAMQNVKNESRPRARDLGIVVGVLPTGPLNAVTDVAGVAVGQTTIIRGDDVRTGVTAVLPHQGNLFMEKVPGAVFVGNGFGKLMGSTQVEELGEIETPILLTSTLNVPLVADALLDYILSLPGNQDVLSVNPIVAETNDGYLNDIRGRHVHKDDVLSAIKGARAGPVDEGSVGAGTGTVAFGFKGGIGTASRRLPASLGGYTIGVLVQTNFGGVLTIAGAPVGIELGRYYLKDQISSAGSGSSESSESSGSSGSSERARTLESSGALGRSELSKLPQLSKHSQLSELSQLPLADGSVIIIVATDAPLDSRNLGRMARRAIMGLARTGAAGSNGSGDYAIAFSTAAEARMPARGSGQLRHTSLLSNDAMSPLFLGVIEATEEAIYNSLFRATTVTGRGHTVDAIPIERTVEILRKYGVMKTPAR
jgi:D-aminopeptidase